MNNLLFFSMILASFACSAQTIKLMNSIEGDYRLAARQVTYGDKAQLLVVDNKANLTKIFSSRNEAPATAALPIGALTGNNLVAIGGFDIIPIIEPSGNCYVGVAKNEKKFRTLNQSASCLLEVFDLDSGFAAWQKSLLTGSSTIAIFDKRFNPIARFNLKKEKIIITSILQHETGFLVANQTDGNATNSQIDMIDKNGVVITTLSVNGLGLQLSKFKNRIFFTYNLDGNPYLSLLNQELRQDWSIKVIDTKKWSATASVVADDQSIYFIGGNDDKLLVTEFDWNGNKKNETLDTKSGASLSSHGYSLVKKSNTILIIGVSPIRKDSQIAKTAVTTWVYSLKRVI